MSRRVGTPQNRIELSSVSVVKLKKKSSTFEVAAYPSKVKDFRAGVEADVDEDSRSPRFFPTRCTASSRRRSSCKNTSPD